jgi:hypothetical protein
MSYQEKKLMTLLITGVLLLAGYLVYLFQQYQAGVIDMAHDLKFWASAMLIFIGVSIVVTIIVLIIFHITHAIVQEVKKTEADDPALEDEMDKLIELKSARIFSVVFGVGFIISLVTLVLQQSPVLMLNILFFSCLAGSFLESITQLLYYRRGIKNV